MDLSGHYLENDGDNLVELIKSLAVDPLLQQLYLENCSIQEKDCTEMLQYISEFKHLTYLNLNGNFVGKAGIHIVEMVKRAGLDSPLQLLYLSNCSIPTDTLGEILKCLKRCKQLTHLGLGGHSLENIGENLVELIKSFGVDPPLQKLYLDNCLVWEMETGNDWSQQTQGILKCLYKCSNLIYLSLKGNPLTGELSYFLCDHDSTLPSVRNLDLTDVGLNKDDVNHLKTLVKSGRMPNLGGPVDTHALWLDENNLAEMVHELESLLNACLNKHQKELKIALFNNNLSAEFVEKWTKRCEGTHLKIFF